MSLCVRFTVTLESVQTSEIRKVQNKTAQELFLIAIRLYHHVSGSLIQFIWLCGFLIIEFPLGDE